jgi:hypothetical protein
MGVARAEPVAARREILVERDDGDSGAREALLSRQASDKLFKPPDKRPILSYNMNNFHDFWSPGDVSALRAIEQLTSKIFAKPNIQITSYSALFNAHC